MPSAVVRPSNLGTNFNYGNETEGSEANTKPTPWATLNSLGPTMFLLSRRNRK